MVQLRLMLREGQVARGKLDALYTQKKNELDKNSGWFDSPNGEKLRLEIIEKYNQKAAQIRAESVKRLKAIIETSNENIESHFKKEPTQAMVNNITLLNMRQNITPSELNVYIDMYGDCYMAFSVLKEKAESLGYQLHVSLLTIDQMKWALEVVGDNVIGFVEGYNSIEGVGDTPAHQVMITRLERYFRSELNYATDFSDARSSEDSAMNFWNDIVGFGDPAMFDKEGTVRKSNRTAVAYYFADMDGLLGFINIKTQNMNPEEKDTTINNILKDCPDQYGTAYRYYLSTGEKIDLQG